MSQDANETNPAAVTPTKQDVSEDTYPDEDLPVKGVWNIGDEVWVKRTAGGATPSASSSTQSYQYYSGIVCYLGSVLFAAGDDWVGIRLTGDSAGKGKNDGAVQGMRYFAAPPNSGLFVRMSSLRVRSSKATPMSSSSASTATPVRTTMERATTPLSSNRMDRTPAPQTMIDSAAEETMPSTTMVSSNRMERTPAPKTMVDTAAEETKRPAASNKVPTTTKNGNNKKGMTKQDSKDPRFPDILSPDDGSTKKNAAKGTKKAAAAKSAAGAAATEATNAKKAPPANEAPKVAAVATTTTTVAAAPTVASTKSSARVAPKSSTTTAAPSAAAKSTASSKAAPVKTTTGRGSSKKTNNSKATPSPQDAEPDAFRLHTAITPIPSDENENNEWQFQQAEEGLFSPERRQSSAATPQRRRGDAPMNGDDDNDEDKFDWSLSQQRWIRFLLGLSIFGIWILTAFVLFCGLEGLDVDKSDSIPSNSTNSTPALWVEDGMHVHPHIHHLETPSPHAWLPASLLLLLSILAGILRLPLCQTPRHGTVTPLAVYTSRLAAMVVALTSLVVIAYITVFTFVVGEEDSLAKTHIIGKMPRWMLWLLVDVLVILIPSCVALMLGFYPGYDPSYTSEAEGEDNNPAVQQSFQSEVVPLLNGSSDNLGDDEEAGNYRLMGDGENGEANEGSLTTTSRVRGSRRLLQMAASQVMYLYLGCAVLLLRLPFSLAIPHFVSTTLTALALGHYADAHREILTLAVCGSIDAFLDFWCIFLFGYANLRIVKRVRLDLFQRLLHMECAFLDAHHSGTLTSRLNSDCSAMASDLTWFFRFSIESVVRIVGIAVYMLIRSPQLAGCALAIVPAVAVVNKIYGDWLAQNAAAVQDALASTQTVAQEALTHIRTVISLGAELQIFHSYRDRVLKHYDLNVRQTFWQGVYYMFVSTFLINTVVQASLLWYGAYLTSQDRLTAGVLLAFMLYQGQLQNETMNLFQSYSSLIKSSGAGDQVFSLLDRRTPPPGLGYGVEPTEDDQDVAETSSLAVEFEKVTFRYPSRPEHKVLDGFNWKVPAGTTVALVGPSGCGKSTVLGLVQRLYDPSAGRIFVNNKDLRQKNLVHYRKQIGVVTQDCVLFDGTIFDNIVFGWDESEQNESEEEIEARVTRAAELANLADFVRTLPLGFETQVGEGGTQLSGGQKQRLAIARAIYRQPALLILDEATSSLDAASERLVQEALDHLLEQRKGMTTLIVAHRLQTVQGSDAICVLENGKITEQGTHNQLMRQRGLYYAMVGRFVRSGVMNH
eukprot:scaffold1341_cov178-Amphora_coffeaeformis.AAC.16